ncbi:M23 family metallopeptidase [Candidatus Sororendozoicomonas aggregata]|uniref:M23 family metallopeptidase n=1 Tax=Candidatus Sororendozoicomonas aggregata TaxID=3073239 RepID=UPI002ED21D63
MIANKWRHWMGLGISLFASSLPVHASLKSALTQGGVYSGQVEPGSKVFYLGQEVSVTEEGRFVFGFGRDAPLNQSYQTVSPSGEQKTVRLELVPRQYKVQKINGIAKKYIQPAKAVLERIRLENIQVRAAREHETEEDDFFQGFTWPLTGPVTGVYGSQRVFNGERRRPHFGVDIAAPTGTLIKAPADGVVTLSERNLYFSGGTLIIDHGYGMSSSFLHLSDILVKVGQVIKRGDAIAKVGATGRVTGAHLDWRINWFDKRLDPQLLAGAQK